MGGRIFKVQVNLDEMCADLDSLDSDAEKLHWLSGFRIGSRGAVCSGSPSPAKEMGHRFGFRCYESAAAFHALQSDRGRKSAEAKKFNRTSTTVEPRLNHGSNQASTGPQPDLNLSSNQYPISNNQKRETSAHATGATGQDREIQEQDPADVIGPVIKSPPPKANIQATGKDLLASLGGMLDWFRSKDGRTEAESDLEAALTIATHQEIETAVRWGFKKLNKKIRTSEVLDAVQGYREHLINERINQPDPVLVRALAEANRMGFDAVAKLLGLECDPALVPEILSENPGTLAEFAHAIA